MTSHSRSDRSPSISELRCGAAVFDDFELAPDVVHLNHGSYGALPRAVAAEQERWRARIERDPTTFLTYELPDLLRGMAGHVARRFGGAAADWVFCENATSAINGVLASRRLEPGDEIVTTSHAYGAVSKAMRAWADRRGASSLVIANLPGHIGCDDDVVAAVAAVLGPRCKLLIVDHITSATAIILPVRRLVDLAHREGVAVLVDGAHAPGQIPLDVPSIGADWYTGNAHKWLFAPRGCGLLWTAPARQSGTFPAVLSHGTEDGYTAAFDWIGTRDVTPWLCFEAGAKAHEGFGGDLLIERNRLLAEEGANLLAREFNAVAAAPSSMRAAMAALVFEGMPGDSALAASLRKVLIREHGIVLPVHAFGGNLWLRISAQIYNRIEDYRRCVEALRVAATSLGFRG